MWRTVFSQVLIFLSSILNLSAKPLDWQVRGGRSTGPSSALLLFFPGIVIQCPLAHKWVDDQPTFYHHVKHLNLPSPPHAGIAEQHFSELSGYLTVPAVTHQHPLPPWGSVEGRKAQWNSGNNAVLLSNRETVSQLCVEGCHTHTKPSLSSPECWLGRVCRTQEWVVMCVSWGGTSHHAD